MLNCLNQVLRIDLRFSFYCSGSKILKIDLSKTVIMHVISLYLQREKVLFGAFD